MHEKSEAKKQRTITDIANHLLKDPHSQRSAKQIKVRLLDAASGPHDCDNRAQHNA
jgi:hypothetical protein